MNALITTNDAVIQKGQRAWTRIKATAAEQRQLWREVGEALLVGRRTYRADRVFKLWCDEHGFDMKPNARTGAMWLAENWSTVTVGLPPDLTHPENIRQWHRDQAPAPTPELALDTPAPSVNLDGIAQQARKIHALANSADAGDETAATKPRKADFIFRYP
jgi:hypothetical protein